MNDISKKKNTTELSMKDCRGFDTSLRKIYSKRGKKLNEEMKLCYSDKLLMSINTIKKALSLSKNPVIASSFGKDSVVLTYLVHQINNKVPIVFTNTGVNFKETIKYKEELNRKWNLNIHELKPEMSFWEIVKKHGYPKESRNSKKGDKREPKCCKILKNQPMKKFIKSFKPDLVFVGLLGDEGRQRRFVYINKGSAIYENKSEKIMKCIPLIWWNIEDIWKFYEKENIKINPVYKKYAINRTGCIPCTGHKGWKKQLGRTHPKMLRKITIDTGQNLLSEFMEIK